MPYLILEPEDVSLFRCMILFNLTLGQLNFLMPP